MTSKPTARRGAARRVSQPPPLLAARGPRCAFRFGGYARRSPRTWSVRSTRRPISPTSRRSTAPIWSGCGPAPTSGWPRAAGAKVSFLPFIAKATAAALGRFPQLNATLDEAAGEIIQWGHVHLGFATATESGLIVPVVRNADRLSITDMGREIDRLATATRAGKVAREELDGSTFTITSLGALGGLMATPIINHPEVAILGVHRIIRRPGGDRRRDRHSRPHEPLHLRRSSGGRRLRRGPVRGRHQGSAGSPGVARTRADLVSHGCFQRPLRPFRSLARRRRRRVCPPLPLPPRGPRDGLPRIRAGMGDLGATFVEAFSDEEHRRATGLARVLSPDGIVDRAGLPALDPALLREVYRTLLRVRVLGDEVRALSAAERIAGVPETRGYEAAAVGAAAALDAGRRDRAGASGWRCRHVSWSAGPGRGRAAPRDGQRPGAGPASSRAASRRRGLSTCCPPLISRPPGCRMRRAWPGR